VVKAAVKEAVTQVRREFGAVREQTEQLSANQRRANITAFCEAQVKAGKILPSELDDAGGKRPTLIDRLMRADARATVRKFSEKGKTLELTELDLQMREIEDRPVLLKYGERTRSSGRGSAAETPADSEIAKVEAHYEQFSESFQKLSTTKDDFVKAFKSRQKSEPGFTAERFLNISGRR
jgi:hypothetical protein